MTRMNCDEVSELLHAYIDEELPSNECRAIAEHLATCRGCAATHARLRAIGERVRHAGTFTLPNGLEERIAARLGPQASPSPRLYRLAGLAASHVAAALLGGGLIYAALTHLDDRDRMLGDVIAAHGRLLLDEQASAISSGERHTVKPWFAGRIAFAPPVRELMAQGFPLLGGRVDYLRGRQAAVLVYARRKHRVHLFVQPVGDAHRASAHSAAHAGYHVITWRDAAFQFVAVSDLNAAELREFAEGFARQPG